MSVIEALNNLYGELAKYKVQLRKLKVHNLAGLKDVLLDAQYHKLCNFENLIDDNCVVYTKDFRYILSNDPWEGNYGHDEDMSQFYFFAWRPAFEAIAKLPNPIGAEIGVFEGFLTKQVLKHINPQRYYLIDPYKVFVDKVGELSNYTQEKWNTIYIKVRDTYTQSNVKLLRKSSEEALTLVEDESLDFVYIDGNHSKEVVYNDVKGWSEKVREGGIVSGHDYKEPSVKDGISKFVEEMKDKDIAITVESRVNDWLFVKDHSLVKINQ